MKIGKVLWVINGETRTIVPVRIVEKITKETIQGERVEFIIESTGGKKLNLSSVKDNYYETIDEARLYLMTAAQRLIDEIVVRAQEAARKFQTDQRADHDPVQPVRSHDTIDSEEAPTAIELPDGTMARVRIKVPEVAQ